MFIFPQIKKYNSTNEISFTNIFGKEISKSKESENLLLIIFIGLILNIILLFIIPIRGDEPYTLMTTSHGPLFAIEKAISFELQAPFYFFLISIWRLFNSSLIWARLFSIIFYPFIVYFSFKASKKYIPQYNPHIFSALVAFNPTIVLMTCYARKYSLVLFLAVTILLLFYEAYLSDDHRKIYRILFVIISIISLFTEYYFGFMLFAAGISLLFLKNKKIFKNYLIDMILPVASLIILLPFIPTQLKTIYNPANKLITIFGYLQFLYERFEIYLIPIDYLKLNLNLQIVLRFVIFLIFIYSTYSILKNKSYHNKNVLIITLWITISFLFFIYILHTLGEAYIEPKHTIIILIPAILVFYSFLSWIQNKRIKLIWFIIIFSIFIGSIAKHFIGTNQLSNVVNYVNTNENNNEPILLYSYQLQKFFPYYYKGSNNVIGLPENININKPLNISKWAYHNTQEIKNNWAQFKNLEFLWLVTDKHNTNIIMGVNFHYNLLNEFINNYFLILDKKKFGNYEVRKLSPLNN